MIIHVVSAGEDIFSIARRYGVPAERIIRDNEFEDPNDLVVGQNLVILFYSSVYRVQMGDTLSGIAAQNGISVKQLYRNNPSLRAEPNIYPGQVLVLDFNQRKQGRLVTNGYTYTNIDPDILRRTLPYLTYVTIFTYGFTEEGDLLDIDDEAIITAAREIGTAPVMHVSTLGEDGNFSNVLASRVLRDDAVQSNLISQIISTMEQKGYAGVDVDFEYIFPEERDLYTAFVDRLTEEANARGFTVFVALAPKTDAMQPGILYEGHDYRGLGEAANMVILMTYEWGYTYGPPMAVAPIDKVTEVVQYALTEIPADKILMGIPNYGYDWTLPFVKGESMARSIGNVEAVDIARENGAAIRFASPAAAPTFNYYADGAEHEVWFEDAQSIASKLSLAGGLSLDGVSYWNIMRYFPQNWLVLNALYEITDV